MLTGKSISEPKLSLCLSLNICRGSCETFFNVLYSFYSIIKTIFSEVFETLAINFQEKIQNCPEWKSLKIVRTYQKNALKYVFVFFFKKCTAIFTPSALGLNEEIAVINGEL